MARGRIGRGAEADLVDRYLRRVTWPVRITELPDRGGRMPVREADTVLVAMDETGEQIASREFASRLGRWRDDGRREVRFLIGAADGLEDGDLAAADLKIAFGRATWPHLMARAMLAEQIWRGVSILANHPYHREG